MNIFKRKKKIDTVLFWKNKVDYLFSEKFKNAIELLFVTKKGLLQNDSSSIIYDHIIAVYIEILGISIGRNGASREKRYDILKIQKETIESYGSSTIADLVDEYNHEFGSSMSDGVRQMAQHFTLSIKGEDNIELENFIYELFYAVIHDSFKELKTIKLN
jgi:hypothetical protein